MKLFTRHLNFNFNCYFRLTQFLCYISPEERVAVEIKKKYLTLFLFYKKLLFAILLNYRNSARPFLLLYLVKIVLESGFELHSYPDHYKI